MYLCPLSFIWLCFALILYPLHCKCTFIWLCFTLMIYPLHCKGTFVCLCFTLMIYPLPCKCTFCSLCPLYGRCVIYPLYHRCTRPLTSHLICQRIIAGLFSLYSRSFFLYSRSLLTLTSTTFVRGRNIQRLTEGLFTGCKRDLQ